MLGRWYCSHVGEEVFYSKRKEVLVEVELKELEEEKSKATQILLRSRLLGTVVPDDEK